MPHCALDHLVVTAPTLNAGAEYVRRTLGVAPQAGGEHVRMGTHNLLLRLGKTAYLEVIAINPLAPAPGRRRWFALDRMAPDAAPRLSAWVARTDDIHRSTEVASEALGAIEPMRRGALDWLITIPDDGLPRLNGAAPALIEWRTERHPALNLPDHGLHLIRFELFTHEPQRLRHLLESLGMTAPVSVSTAAHEVEPHLVAHIGTPQGVRLLSAPDSAPDSAQ